MKGDPRGPLEEAEERMQAQVTERRVGPPSAENLRFPGEGQSARGKAAPKLRLKSVGDGNPVHIPEPALFLSERRVRRVAAGER